MYAMRGKHDTRPRRLGAPVDMETRCRGEGLVYPCKGRQHANTQDVKFYKWN